MNIYVGNLDYSINEGRLRELFVEFGEVKSAKVISDMFSGQSKGFGFIEMEKKADALNAIQSLNGQEVEGRNLKVNESQPREERRDNRR